MRVGRYKFRASWFVSAVFVAMFLCMLRLGVWQLDQAERKNIILAAAAESASTAAVAIESVNDLATAAVKHTKVKFSGKYTEQHQFLWDNRVHKGQAGYEVIAPVQLSNGKVVLLNRGWVAPGSSRQDLPQVSLPPAMLESAPIEFSGLVSRPSKGLASGESVAPSDAWPKVLQFFDYNDIERLLGVELIDVIVQPQTVEVPVQRPDYLIANWEPTASIGPARHYSYAFQWFAMAFALCVLYLVYNTKKIVNENE